MRKSAVAVVSLGIASLVVLAASFSACVSNNGSGPPSADGGFTFDASEPGFDATIPDSGPSADSSPGIDSPPSADATPGKDATTPTPDAGPKDAAPDATDSGTIDAADAAEPPADASFTDALVPSNWAAFDTASLDAGLISFAGATFDGRYAYIAPWSSAGAAGIVARFDSTLPFNTPAAWTTFATGTVVTGGSGGFSGTVFDGQYVYFVPFHNESKNTEDQTFVRYDTHGSFTDPGAWLAFDASAAVVGPFVGGVFDGRYVRFASHFSTQVAAYDTTLAFNDVGSWSTFDTSTLNPPVPTSNLDVFAGTLFDGKYVYFVGPTMARVDTTAAPDAGASAWESFTTASADAGAFAYWEGAYDGRYIYTLNFGADRVGRYDTTLPFGSPSSWTSFNVASVGGTTGYFGAAFDGRTLYFVPNGATFAAYDTQGSFADASSWSTFNTTPITSIPNGYQTAFFDGQYIYATAASNAFLLRFEAKTAPGPLPSLPQWHGSFY